PRKHHETVECWLNYANSAGQSPHKPLDLDVPLLLQNLKRVKLGFLRHIFELRRELLWAPNGTIAFDRVFVDHTQHPRVRGVQPRNRTLFEIIRSLTEGRLLAMFKDCRHNSVERKAIVIEVRDRL